MEMVAEDDMGDVRDRLLEEVGKRPGAFVNRPGASAALHMLKKAIEVGEVWEVEEVEEVEEVAEADTM
jgi:trehalose-6-phosphatase